MEKLFGGAGAGVPRGRDGGDQRPRGRDGGDQRPRGRCGRASRASGPLDARPSPRGAPRGLGRASRGPDALDARPHRPRGRWSPPSRPRGRWSPPSRPRGTPAPAPPKSFSKNVLASPSEFPYSTSSHGGVAQLGERLTGSQEVRGSIPLVSTRALNEAPTQVGAFFHIGTQGQRRHHDPPGRQDRKKLRRARPL